MENGRIPSGSSKTSKTLLAPRRLCEKGLTKGESRIINKYALSNKTEFLRAKYNINKIQKTARRLLALEEKDGQRVFEGRALMRRLVRQGVLDEDHMELDHVLDLKIEDFLERRLQTLVFRLGLAKSMQHARDVIRLKHIRVQKRVVNIPSFMVRADCQDLIDSTENMRKWYKSESAPAIKIKEEKD